MRKLCASDVKGRSSGRLFLLKTKALRLTQIGLAELCVSSAQSVTYKNAMGGDHKPLGVDPCTKNYHIQKLTKLSLKPTQSAPVHLLA
jgi:hypothetical protein